MAELGFVLTRPPHEGPGLLSFTLLARAALAEGHGVRAFFYLDAVYHLLRGQEANGGPSHPPPEVALRELVELGARVSVSHLCLRSSGVSADQLVEGIRVGTMEDLSELVGEVDRVVCL